MKRNATRIAIVICCALAAISCGSENTGPTAPTMPPTTVTPPTQPSVPAVAGAYTGEVTAWLNDSELGTFPVNATVTQEGDQVTMDGNVEGGVLRFERTTGTIASDGTWTPNDPLSESEACGHREWLEHHGVFRNGMYESEHSYDSEHCGVWRFEMSLTRN